VEVDEGRWWGGVDKMVVVVGLRVCKHEGSEGAGAQKNWNQAIVAQLQAAVRLQ
jgi:hypothetical protein